MDNLSFEKFKMIKNYLLIKKEKKSLHDYLIDKNNNYINGLFSRNNKKILRAKLIDYNFKERTNFEKLYQNNLINHYCNRDIKKTMGYSQNYLHNLTDLLSKSNNNDNFIEERINLLSLKVPINLRKKNKVENELFNHKKLNLTGNDRYFYNKSIKNFKSFKNKKVSENNKYKYYPLFDFNEYLQDEDIKQPLDDDDDDEDDKEKIETKHIIHLKDYYNFFDPNKKSYANKYNLKKLHLEKNNNKINLMKNNNPGAKEFIKGIICKRNKNESSIYYDVKNNIKNNNIFPIIKNNNLNNNN